MSVDGDLTGLQERDLVVLAEQTETRDVFRKLHHVLHGLGQANGTVLPHLIHRLGGDRDRQTRREGEGWF